MYRSVLMLVLVGLLAAMASAQSDAPPWVAEWQMLVDSKCLHPELVLAAQEMPAPTTAGVFGITLRNEARQKIGSIQVQQGHLFQVLLDRPYWSKTGLDITENGKNPVDEAFVRGTAERICTLFLPAPEVRGVEKEERRLAGNSTKAYYREYSVLYHCQRVPVASARAVTDQCGWVVQFTCADHTVTYPKEFFEKIPPYPSDLTIATALARQGVQGDLAHMRIIITSRKIVPRLGELQLVWHGTMSIPDGERNRLVSADFYESDWTPVLPVREAPPRPAVR